MRTVLFSLALTGFCTLASIQAADTLTDAAALVSNYNDLTAIDQQLAADRAAMQTALTSNGNLRDTVRTFFHDRDSAATIDNNFFINRVRLRRDIGFIPFPLTKPPKAQGLSIDAANYIKDFDARSAAFNAVANDISRLRSSVAASDLTAVTSNANAFFLDRHALVQAHVNEGGDIGAMRKDLRFRGRGNVSRPRHSSLSDNVRKYLADRQSWLDIGVKVASDRDAIRAGLNSSSLSALVQQFLLDHHQLFLLQKQLGVDRDIMRLQVGFKLPRRAQNFFGSIVGVKNTKEETIANEDVDQDVAIDNVGEK